MKVVFVLMIALTCIGCGDDSSTRPPEAATYTPQPIENLEGTPWFGELLIKVDAALGKRFQYMQFSNMETASYMTALPVTDISAVIEADLLARGFSKDDNEAMESAMGAAEQSMLKNTSTNMTFDGVISYSHENGDRLTITKTTVEDKANGIHLNMAIIQLMNFNDFMEQQKAQHQTTVQQ